MSNKYKNEMNNIKVSNELKQKTLLEIKNRQTSDYRERKIPMEIKSNRNNSKRSKFNISWFKVVPIAAVSLILIFASVYISDNISVPNPPNEGLFDDDSMNGSIMRAVGKIKQLSSDDKGNYIVVSTNNDDIKFYYNETTKLYFQDKPSDKTMLKKGSNVEILYAGISSQPKKEYRASKITSDYSENVDVPDTRVKYSDLHTAKEALNREIIIPEIVPEGYKLDYIEVITNEILEIGYYNNADFIVYTETMGRVQIGGIIPKYDYVDTMDKDNISYRIKGYDDKITHVEWSNNEHHFSILFQEGVTKEKMFEMIESLSEY